jgi:hypothetical protein
MAHVLSLPEDRTSSPAPAPTRPVEPTATLRSDRFAFGVWVTCAVLTVVLLLKDLFAAIVAYLP